MNAIRRQHGLVLLMALIMLLLVTILGVVAASEVQNNLKIVQNVEARSAIRNAALRAIQEAIATPGFLKGEQAFSQGCNGSSFTRCLDLSGDGVENDAVIELSRPVCISGSPIRNAQLDALNSPEDASCFRPGLYSLCAEALWEVTALAQDLTTGAKVEVRQGLQTRTSLNLLASACS
jgi:hypothetical protein